MKILIVDDEPLAREGLQLQLARAGYGDIVGHCGSGREAVRAITTLRPDLVFLDINMPGGDGFEVVEQVGIEHMPLVVFLTAYDEYAIRAFTVNALDYLLKPLNETRLAESLQRAEQALRQQRLAEQQSQLGTLLQQFGSGSVPGMRTRRLMVRSAGHVYFIRHDDISHIQADGDYVTVHTPGKRHLVRATLKTMEEKLVRQGFQRIHRSALVRLDSIRELVCNDNGDYTVVLQDDTELKLGRSYRDELCARLQATP